jgi:hypothetical protein
LPAAESIVLESIGYSDDLSQGEILGQIRQSLEALCKSADLKDPEALRKELLPIISIVGQAWTKLDVAYQSLDDSDKKSFKEDFEAEKARWSGFDGTDKTVLNEALNNAISTWRAVEEAKFEIWVGPFFSDGDELILKITASRKAGMDARFPTKHTCTEKPVVRLRTMGGIKLDFSTGFVFGWPSDRVYDVRKITTDTGSKNEIVESKDNEALCAVAPAIFLHVYPRNGRDFTFAGTLGLAMNGSTIFDYYLGGSALFGASQRGVLTIGVGVRTITKLSGKYKEHDEFPADAGTIPVVKVLHFAICIGLSFNLGGV